MILEHSGIEDLHQIFTFAAAKKIGISNARGACIKGRCYLEITLKGADDFFQIELMCAEFCKASQQSTVFNVLKDPRIIDEIRTLLSLVKADVLLWSPAEGLQGATSKVMGEYSCSDPRDLKLSRQSFRILKSCMKKDGLVNSSLVRRLSPAIKPKLIYSDLNAGNALDFCDKAACAVFGNILMECAGHKSHFCQLPLERQCKQILDIADREDVESGLALSILLHISKCSSLKRARTFLTLVNLLHRTPLKIVDLNEGESSLLRKAKEILATPEYSRILLTNTNMNDATIISNMKVTFVEIESEEVRGWAGPSTVVVNKNAVKKTMHLKRYGPLTGLLGHEMRHVILRMAFGCDLNFSSPEKSNLACPSLRLIRCDSGYWFENTAIGEKFRFTTEYAQIDELIDSIEKGFDERRVPALSPEQVLRFSVCIQTPNEQMAIDYDSASEID